MILPRLLRHDSRVSLLGRSLKDRDRVSRMRHGAEASKARSDLVRAPALDGGLPGGVEAAFGQHDLDQCGTTV